MIGRLRGTLAEKQPPHLIIDVNGVGYELEVPMTTLYRLPKVGESVTVHTHLVVREDAHLLYGFAESASASCSVSSSASMAWGRSWRWR